MAQPEERQLSPRAQIKRLLGVIFRAVRYWPVVVVAATLAVGAGWIAPSIVKPGYQSETRLLYREVIQARSVVGQNTASNASLGRNGGRRLVEMLMSRTNLEAIIKEMNLFPSTVENLGMIEAIAEMRRHAECKAGRGDSFTISYNGEDPEEVFNVTQRLANSLMEVSANYRATQTESTKEFLQKQYEQTQAELQRKEQEQAVFLAQHPEFAQAMTAGGMSAPGVTIRAKMTGPGGRPLPAMPRPPPPPESSDPTVRALERQQARLRQQLAADGSAPAPVAVAPPPPAQLSPETQRAIRQAEDQVDRAQRALLEARASKTDSHPDVVAARSRLQAAQNNLSAVKASAANPVSPVAAPPPSPVKVNLSDADRQRLRAQLRSVEDALKTARGASTKGAAQPVKASADGNAIVALETEWTNIQREVASIRERNRGLQRLLFNANILSTIEQSGESAQMIVIDPPFKPTRPFRRGKRRVSAVAAFLVLMMGVGVALALAFLDDRVYDAIDVEGLKIGKLSHEVPAAAPRGKRGKS